MGVDLTSKTWESGAQLLQWRLDIAGPIAGACLAVCVLAQAIFYIFPRLRVFPRSLLSWLNWYNIAFEIYIIFKWSPYSALNSDWIVNVKAGSFLCRLGLFLDQYFLLGPMMCITLICLTIFLLIVLRVDVEHRREIFWIYLAVALIFPLVVSYTPTTRHPTPQTHLYFSPHNLNDSGNIAMPAPFTDITIVKGFGVCSNGNASILLALRAVYLALTALQVAFLVGTFLYIKRVFSETANTSVASGHFPAKYLFIRFFITFLAQTFGLLPAQILDVSALLGDAARENILQNAIYFRFAVIRYFEPMLDALVLIFGNVDFMDWVKKKLSIYIKHPYFTSSTTGPEEKSNGAAILEKRPNTTVAVEMERLAEASSAMGTSTPKHLSLGDLKTTVVEEDDDEESKQEV